MSDAPGPNRGPIDIWMVTDNKAGHENQILGLVDRLRRRADVRAHRIVAPKRPWVPPWGFRRGTLAELPNPDLILCAGRRTHRLALSVKRRRGGILIVCMRPYIGHRQFDLCLIPRHDEPERAPNVETTTGAIVNVSPSHHHDDRRGVILVGGPSAHFGMDVDALLQQVSSIVESTPDTRWALTTSRRTPDEAARKLASLRRASLEVVHADKTPKGWVRERLAESARSWITSDSVSMVCESLTAGCATGVLPMPAKAPGGRVQRCIDDLSVRGFVTSYEAWRETGELPKPSQSLDEADRCARLILRRFFPGEGDVS